MERMSRAASGRSSASSFGSHRKQLTPGNRTAWYRNLHRKTVHANSQNVASADDKVVSCSADQWPDDQVPLLGMYLGPELFDLQTREKIFRAVSTSGFNFLHACSLHFDEDGGIYFDSPEFALASEGQWIDSTGFSTALEDLKVPETNKLGIERVYMTIGGKEVEDFERIADLMDMDDSYPNDVQRNIRAIYNGCPAIDGFNIDGRSFSEEDVSEDLVTALTNLCKICIDEGFYVSFTASGSSTWWATCVKELIEYFSPGLSHINIEISESQNTHDILKTVKSSLIENGVEEAENIVYPFFLANQQTESFSVFGDKYGGVIVSIPHSQPLSSYSNVFQMVVESVSRKEPNKVSKITSDEEATQYLEDKVEGEKLPEASSVLEAIDPEPPLETLQERLSTVDSADAAEEGSIRDSMDLESLNAEDVEIDEDSSPGEIELNEEEDLSLQPHRLREIKARAERVLSELTKQTSQGLGDKSEKIALSKGLDDIMSLAEKILSDISQSDMTSAQVESASKLESSMSKIEFFFQDEACEAQIEKFIEELERLKNSSESEKSNSTSVLSEEALTDVESLDLWDSDKGIGIEDESVLEVNESDGATPDKVYENSTEVEVDAQAPVDQTELAQDVQPINGVEIDSIELADDQAAVSTATDGVEDGAMDDIKDKATDDVEDGAVDDIKDGATDDVEDGAVGDIKDGAVNHVEDGVVDHVEDGVVNHVEDRAVEHVEDGAMNYVEDGAVEHVEDEAVDHVEDEAVNDIKNKAMDRVEDGVVDHVEDGADDHAEDEAVDDVEDGAMNYVEDGAVEHVEDAAVDDIKDKMMDHVEDEAVNGVKDETIDALTDAEHVDEYDMDFLDEPDYDLPLIAAIADGRLLKTEIYGGDQKGQDFDDFREDIITIREIVVYYGEHVNGIKATYDLVDGTQYEAPVRGRPDGEKYHLLLRHDEYLVNIETMAGWWIDRVHLYTRNVDNEIILHGPFGGGGGYKTTRMENEPPPHSQVGDNDDLVFPVVCLCGETLNASGKEFLSKIGLYVKRTNSSRLEQQQQQQQQQDKVV